MLNLFLNYFIYKVYKYCESLKPKAEQYVCFKYQLLWLNSIRKTVFSRFINDFFTVWHVFDGKSIYYGDRILNSPLMDVQKMRGNILFMSLLNEI